jgi:hypothetical protein
MNGKGKGVPVRAMKAHTEKEVQVLASLSWF